MLLEIRLSNFCSIKDTITVSMLAESLAEHKEVLFTHSKKSTDRKALPLKLFYGNKDTGKEKLLDGLKLLQKLLCEQIKLSSIDTAKISYDDTKPIHLGVTISIDGFIYDYDVKFIKNYCESEVFKVNNLTLFERTLSDVKINKTPKSLTFYEETSIRHLNVNERQFNLKHLNFKNKLFLTSMFYDLIATKTTRHFLSYVCNKIVFYTCHRPDINRIRALVSEYNIYNNCISKTDEIACDIENAIKYCIENGCCLIIGGENINIDPLKLIETIKTLHNPRKNNKGQLLLSTYQYILMNKELIRRDEIEFVYKEKDCDCTKIANLSHLAIREENYMKKYLSGEYVGQNEYSNIF